MRSSSSTCDWAGGIICVGWLFIADAVLEVEEDGWPRVDREGFESRCSRHADAKHDTPGIGIGIGIGINHTRWEGKARIWYVSVKFSTTNNEKPEKWKWMNCQSSAAEENVDPPSTVRDQ